MIKSQSVHTVESTAIPQPDNGHAIDPLLVDSPISSEAIPNLAIRTNLKIGSFHIGSAMADILGSGVWNRIMIADLNFAATPVSLLLSLNYFLSPIAIWTGQRSDHTNWRGYRRLPWVWAGRALMAIGFIVLALTTVELAETRNNIWWGGIALALTSVGLGAAISGSTYTTLIYDRAPAHQRGRALGVAWTMLLLGFALAGGLFAQLLPEYSTSGVLVLFTTAVAIMVALWVFSIFGEEHRLSAEAIEQQASSAAVRPNFLDDLREVWSKPSTRLFFLYIGFSFMGAFAQDQILEPFGGQVFDLTTGETSRFAAFWGTTALLGSILGLVGYRRLQNFSYTRINTIGIWTLVVTFIMLAVAAYGTVDALIRPTLLLFGLGLGMWNIGTWGLMVSVSSAEKAGTYFGLWTMASLIFRGGGSVLGAAFRDISLAITDQLTFAYGTVFLAEAVVMLIALFIISRLQFSHKPDATTQTEQQQLLLTIAADG